MVASTSNKKIKVAFFDEAVAFGGSVVVLAHLFNHIDRTKFIPQLVTSLDEESLKFLFKPEDVLCWFKPKLHYASRARWMNHCPGSSQGIKRIWAYLFTLASYVANFPAYAHLFFKIAMNKPDIVHFNNGKEGLLIAKAFDIPMVWHLHGFAEDSVQKIIAMQRYNVPMVSISRYISEEAIKSGAKPENVFDIPNPAPTFSPSKLTRDEWRAHYKIPRNAIVCAHVGRVVRWKGQLEFLQAFAEITTRCPDAIALIVGDDVEGLSSDYPTALRQLVKEKHLEDKVIFTGHVSNIVELMSFSDVVVHSSIEPEPFGLVITEAMIAGAAVIAARLGAPIEIIDEGKTGLLVDPQNTTEFAAALLSLVTDKELRETLAAAGQTMATQRYSPVLFASKMEGVYQLVMGKSARQFSQASSQL